MTKQEITQILQIVSADPRTIEMVQFAFDQGTQHQQPKYNPAPYVSLTAAEIIDCAAAVYQCDPNDVSERDLKFARHVERLTLER